MGGVGELEKCVCAHADADGGGSGPLLLGPFRLKANEPLQKNRSTTKTVTVQLCNPKTKLGSDKKGQHLFALRRTPLSM